MVAIHLTYRTTDGTKWGTGKGSDLTATEIDTNMWKLEDKVNALSAEVSAAATGIDHFSVSGGSLYAHMTDGTTQGPFALPAAEWVLKGEWSAGASYDAFDVVTNSGSVYLVKVDHLAGTTFDPGATDGGGHALYGTILSAVEAYQYLSIYASGLLAASEVLARIVIGSTFRIADDCDGSYAIAGSAPSGNAALTIKKNNVAVGTVNFASGSATATFTTADVINLAPGDVFSVHAPAIQDAALADISITFRAQVR